MSTETHSPLQGMGEQKRTNSGQTTRDEAPAQEEGSKTWWLEFQDHLNKQRYWVHANNLLNKQRTISGNMNT